MKGQYILSYFYKPFRGLSLSRNFAKFSLKAAYVTMIKENLKFMVFRLPENVFSTKNIENRIFLFMLLGKVSLSQVHIIIPHTKILPTKACFRGRTFFSFLNSKTFNIALRLGWFRPQLALTLPL